MKPKKEETEIIGKWIVEGGRVIAGEACRRIDWLKLNYFQKVATDSTGWNTLYFDPEDGRLWELSYPDAEMHGAGPPMLKHISEQAAKRTYDNLAVSKFK